MAQLPPPAAAPAAAPVQPQAPPPETQAMYVQQLMLKSNMNEGYSRM